MIVALASPHVAKSLDDGLERIGRLLSEASARGARIVAFPEAYLPGLRGQDFEVFPFDQKDEERALDVVAALARRNRVATILGMEHVTEAGRQIAAVVIDADGRIQGSQTKNQLDPSEDPFYVPGGTRRMFDVDGDLETFIAHVRRDKMLGPLVKRRPYVRLPRLIDPFEGLVRAMLGQQVTVRAASTMTDRFARQFGVPIGPTNPIDPAGSNSSNGTGSAEGLDGSDRLYAFPRPDVIAALADGKVTATERRDLDAAAALLALGPGIVEAFLYEEAEAIQ